MQQNPGLPHGPYSLTRRDDEIDLLDLIKLLWANRLIVVVTTVLIVAVAIGYAFLSAKTFQVTAIVGMPTHAELHKVDQGARYFELTPETEYDRLYQAFVNQDLQRRFYLANVAKNDFADNSLENQRGFEAFSGKLEVSKNEKGRKVSHNTIAISYISTDPEIAYEILSEYIAFANDAALESIREDYSASLDASIKQFEKEIALLVEAKRLNVGNDIDRLKESVKMARAMGIRDSDRSKGDAIKELEQDETTAYLLGAKYLETKIGLLEARENIDSFVPGVSELLIRLEGFKSVKLLEGGASLVNFEKSPMVPYSHIEPRRALIVILGSIMGVFLGCLLALLKGFLNKAKEERPESKKARRVTDRQQEAVSYLMSSEYDTKEKVAQES